MRSMWLRLSFSFLVFSVAALAQAPPPGGGNPNQINPGNQIRWPASCAAGGYYVPQGNICPPPPIPGFGVPGGTIWQFQFNNGGGVFGGGPATSATTGTPFAFDVNGSNMITAGIVRGSQMGKVYIAEGFPNSQTLANGDPCDGTYTTQADVANANVCHYIYVNANQCPGGTGTPNAAACAQAAAVLTFGPGTFLVNNPLGGPNVPYNLAIRAVASMAIRGAGVNKTVFVANNPGMEAVVYQNYTSSTGQPFLTPLYTDFSVDGGNHGVDSTPAQAVWGIELNGTSAGYMEHVNVMWPGSVGGLKLGDTTASDVEFFLRDMIISGVKPVPDGCSAQVTTTMIPDGGGNFHVGALTLQSLSGNCASLTPSGSAGYYYCSALNPSCSVTVRFVGAGVKQCTTLPTATATATNRSVNAITLTAPGVGCGQNMIAHVEPSTTAQYMFYARNWVNSSMDDIRVTGLSTNPPGLPTDNPGFYFNTGGNKIGHTHPEPGIDVGYYDNGGNDYVHPECDGIVDHCFNLQGDGTTIHHESNYWAGTGIGAGNAPVPFSYSAYLGSASSNSVFDGNFICRVGGQPYGGYYQFVDASGPDDALANAPAGTVVMANEYCGSVQFTGTLTSGSQVVAVSNTAGLRVGYPISAPTGIPRQVVTITAITTNTNITMSLAATTNGAQTITMSGPLARTTLADTLINGPLYIGANDAAMTHVGVGSIAFGAPSSQFGGHISAAQFILYDPSTFSASGSGGFAGNFVVSGLASTVTWKMPPATGVVAFNPTATQGDLIMAVDSSTTPAPTLGRFPGNPNADTRVMIETGPTPTPPTTALFSPTLSLGGGSNTVPTYGFGPTTAAGLYGAGVGDIRMTGNTSGTPADMMRWLYGATIHKFINSQIAANCWGSSVVSSPDVALSRSAAGVLSVGDCSAVGNSTKYIQPLLVQGGGSAVTITPGGSVTSATCTSANCLIMRGKVSVVGGTATTGTIASISWGITLPSVPVCWVHQNGTGTSSTGSYDLGWTESATGLTVTAGLSVSGATVVFSYACDI